jgi:putative CocE/NonD family hydrolase
MLAVLNPAQAGEQATSNSVQFEVGVEKDVMVAMRDGVQLATDIYFPMKDGKRLAARLPAVLARTPYNKESPFLLPIIKFFAQNGYISVVQDSRGQFKSSGGFFLYHEAEDGCDTVEWLSGHEWCNGRVGMHGPSSLAWAQLAAATQNPQGLVTIIPHAAPTNAYRGNVRRGGAVKLGFLGWLLRRAAEDQNAKPADTLAIQVLLDNVKNFLVAAYEVPWQRGNSPLSALPVYEDAAFNLFFENHEYNSFWKQPSLAMDDHFTQFPEIPVLWVTGWWDSTVGMTISGFEKLVRLGRDDQYLIVGPWMHNLKFSQTGGDFQFSDVGAPIRDLESFKELELAWFDRWLKEKTETKIGPPVRFCIMGGGDGGHKDGEHFHHGGHWTASRSWPPRNVQKLRLFLESSGRLSRDQPDDADSYTSYRYDPLKTSYSRGRGSVPVLAFDEGDFQPGPRWPVEVDTLPGHAIPGRRIAERNDVIVFQTDPLKHDLRVVGNVTASLWISSNVKDTDFYVALVDTYPGNGDLPGGCSVPITDGILRTQFRESFEETKLMEPGKRYKLTIPLFPTANLFKAGHRLQLYICSSNFPDYDVNPNTGNYANRAPIVATNSVFHEAAYPSFIELEILPEGDGDLERLHDFSRVPASMPVP